jgi:hypothetical protein
VISRQKKIGSYLLVVETAVACSECPGFGVFWLPYQFEYTGNFDYSEIEFLHPIGYGRKGGGPHLP